MTMQIVDCPAKVASQHLGGTQKRESIIPSSGRGSEGFMVEVALHLKNEHDAHSLGVMRVRRHVWSTGEGERPRLAELAELFRGA